MTPLSEAALRMSEYVVGLMSLQKVIRLQEGDFSPDFHVVNKTSRRRELLAKASPGCLMEFLPDNCLLGQKHAGSIRTRDQTRTTHLLDQAGAAVQRPRRRRMALFQKCGPTMRTPTGQRTRRAFWRAFSTKVMLQTTG